MLKPLLNNQTFSSIIVLEEHVFPFSPPLSTLHLNGFPSLISIKHLCQKGLREREKSWVT